MNRVKSERINLRATPEQATTLQQAAAASGRTVTDFVLASAVVQAQRDLAERRWFSVSAVDFEALEALLTEPLPETSRFERLWARPSVFGQPFEIADA